MRINIRCLCKPSIIVLTLIIITTISQIQPCSATDTQNKTLKEITSYHFDTGYYNVVKCAENSETNYRIIQETKIPYINVTYTAQTSGLLEITLKPTEGNSPLMELSNRWETDGLTYTTTMLRNETSYIILTPPMRLLDQNTSTIIGGAIIQMEIYRWQNTSGIINYTFTTSDDITFNTVIHPTHPKQGEKINFFTNSNAKLYKITWNFPELDWINASEVMEINNLEPGTYTVYVTGVDAFNQTHNAHTSFTVLPSSLNPQSFDLDFFSISYPEIVSQGEKITLSTTIDYSMPLPTLIKCTLFDPVNNVECKSLIYNVSDSGSKSFNYQFITNEEGIKSLVLRLYYDIGAGWIEVSEAKTNLSINIKKAQTSTSIPGFNLISIISGLLLIVFLYRTQMNN